jgi:membrane protein DedA with SNARE-associated domain
MHLFTDYLQPLTVWISAHPNWALLITFLVSLSESLVIVGSIIPGSVTMTALGILAGSGIMRVDLTLLAAILGAIAGDSTSYAIGFTFRNHLLTIWPFNRYPTWVNYGKDYFIKHGGKSVVIGRFIGPLRAIIPVVAGMMNMNRLHFFLANAISAFLWAILYVMPGVLIGAASSELSAESASRLFVVILLLLVVIWLFSWTLKWILKKLNHFLRENLHRFWTWLKSHPTLAFYFKLVTPEYEVNHYPTAALLLIICLGFILFFLLTFSVIFSSWVSVIDTPSYLFLQSLRTYSFDTFFIMVNFFINPYSLGVLLLSIVLYTIYYRDWRTLVYWLSLCLTCTTVVFLLVSLIDIPRPIDVSNNSAHFHYPAINLTIATSLFCFLLYYINTRYRTAATIAIRIFLLLILLFSGLGTIYLGDNWLSGVLAGYLIGITLGSIHWLFYRRVNPFERVRSQVFIVITFLTLLLFGYISSLFFFDKILQAHKPSLRQYFLTDAAWWYQRHPLLPIYSMNRVGKRIGLFNIQYAGSLTSIQRALTNYGWKTQSSSFFFFLLRHAGVQKSTEDISLMAQLYQNRLPDLVMAYKQGPDKPLLILRFWQSNYHLQHYSEPIWLGSIYPYFEKNINLQERFKMKASFSPFEHILPALNGFKFNSIILENEYLQPLPEVNSPMLLFIKEPKP